MDICRTCLKVTHDLSSIFKDNLLPHKINVISSLEVSIDDNLPSTICNLCEQNVHLLYDFRTIIIRSNFILLEIKNELPSVEASSGKTNESDIELQSNEITHVEINIHSDNVANILDFENNENNINEFEKPYVKIAIDKAERRKLYKKPSPTSKIEKIEENRKKSSLKKSICNICGVTIRSDNLKKHILIHTEEPVVCTKCGKTCKNSESLRTHMIMHKGINYECKICGKVYKHRGGLTVHRKRHAVGDVKTVPCSICGKLFYDKQVLQKHIRSHTGERPYPCKYCNKGFSSLYARNTHTRQHTDERPYACQFCPLAFAQKVSLKTHLQSKHPTKMEILN